MKIQKIKRVLHFMLHFFSISTLIAQNVDNKDVRKIHYTIKTRINTESKELNGHIKILYHNTSTDTLSYIYLHLYPNAFKSQTTPYAVSERQNNRLDFWFAPEETYGFIDSLHFTTTGNSLKSYSEKDKEDIAQVYLLNPLLPGDSVEIESPFKVKLPAYFSRMGYTKNTYHLTQWYPKPAVYDSKGWHPMHYKDQGEFYGEFAHYKINLEIPQEYILVSTGSILQKKKTTDNFINYEIEADSVHDFAIFLSKVHHIYQDTMQLDQRIIQIESAYVPNQDHTEVWKESIDFIKSSLRFYSHYVGSYPYNQFKLFQSENTIKDGMEYPQMAVVSSDYPSYGLDEIIGHEVGHQWFYGILATDEREEPFLDEGINSFLENKYTEQKYGFYPFDSSWIIRLMGLHKFNSTDQMYYLIKNQIQTKKIQPIRLHSDAFTKENYNLSLYGKSMFALNHVEQFLGPEKMNHYLRVYYDTYRFKHPTFNQFKEIFAAEKNLQWFFEDYLNSNKTIDYKVKKIHNNTFSLRNKGDFSPPLTVQVQYKSQRQDTLRLIGFSGDTTLSLHDPIKSVQIDPQRRTLDINRKNDFKQVGLGGKPIKFHFIPMHPDPNVRAIFLTPTVGFNTSDKWMPGLCVYNSFLTEKTFRYYIHPMYSSRGNAIVGNVFAEYSFYPKDEKEIKIWSRFKKYSIDDIIFQQKFGINNFYHRLSVAVEYHYRNKDVFSPFKQKIYLKAHQTWTNDLSYDINNQAYIDQQQSQIIQAGFEQTYHPHELINNTFQVQGVYLNRSINIQVENKLSWQFASGYFLGWRSFIGILPIHQGNTFIGNALSFNNYAGGGGFAGYPVHDYAFEEVMLDRKIENSALTHQVAIREGGFKSLMRFGIANNYLISSGLDLKIRKLPVHLWGNVAIGDFILYNNTSKIAAEAGFTVDVLPGVFSIHFPLLTTSNIIEDQSLLNIDNVFKRLSFTLKLSDFNWTMK